MILITGAGGSIGSEIARRCIEQNPKKLILIDNSEPNLFYINDQIMEDFTINKVPNKPKVLPLLADAKDQKFLENVFIKEKVEIVFHAFLINMYP